MTMKLQKLKMAISQKDLETLKSAQSPYYIHDSHYFLIDVILHHFKLIPSEKFKCWHTRVSKNKPYFPSERCIDIFDVVTALHTAAYYLDAPKIALDIAEFAYQNRIKLDNPFLENSTYQHNNPKEVSLNDILIRRTVSFLDDPENARPPTLEDVDKEKSVKDSTMVWYFQNFSKRSQRSVNPLPDHNQIKRKPK